MKTQGNPQGQAPSVSKTALATIIAVVFLDVIGLSILFPVQAFIVRQYSDQALMVTLIPGLYAAAQFFGAPILGKLSDRYGRRPILLASLLGSAFGYFLFGIGGALWVLFLSRIIDGFTGGNISTATAYIADVTHPQDRAKTFGLLGAAFGFGFIVGPALGGALSQISLAAPAYAAGILALVEAVVCFFVLPESLTVANRLKEPVRLGDLNPFQTISELLWRPWIGILLVAQAIFNLAFSGYNAILTVFLIDKFSVQPWQLAVVSAAGGIANVIIQALLVGPLSKRLGEKSVAVLALGIAMLSSLLISLAPAFWMVYPIMFLTCSGSGLFYPTMGAMQTNSVSSNEQGRLSGASAALSSLVNLLGPLWVGFAYDQFQPAMPYWSVAFLFLLTGLLLARLKAPVHPVATQTEAG